MTPLFIKQHLRHLVDPLTGKELMPAQGGVAPQDHPDTVYPIIDGIYRFALSDLSAESDRYDEDCRSRGWVQPEETTFRSLPRTPIIGWSPTYWKQRALSTAAVWHIIEGERRKNGRRPMGPQGVAANLSNGLHYLAYGLDLAGYNTFAVSPFVGQYSLGVFPHGRYCRIQASWEALPLRPHSFDLVVVTNHEPEIAPDMLPIVMEEVAELIKDDGYLIVTDTPEVQRFQPLFEAHKLKVRYLSVKGMEDKLLDRIRGMMKIQVELPPLLIATR
jgi:hypothetical protein